ncbi:transposase [Chloroflexota bacterium]
MTLKPLHDPSHLFFETATILGWRQLFSNEEYARIVLDALVWHRSNRRWELFAYVLMPNHLHAVIKPLEPQTISTVLQSFGSFTAHAILEQLRSDRQEDLLAFFSQRHQRDTGKGHQIWQPIQAKNVYSAEFLREKVEYTHNNPVADRWRLVETRADYAYSSACYYDRDEMSRVEVDDVREWMV